MLAVLAADWQKNRLLALKTSDWTATQRNQSPQTETEIGSQDATLN